MRIKIKHLSGTAKKSLNTARLAVMYTSIFILFFFDGAFFPIRNFSGTLILLIDLIAIAGLAVSSGLTLKIKKRLLPAYIGFLMVIISSGLFFFNIKRTLIVAICVTSGFAVANFLDYNSFKKIYKEMMLFLALFSLLTLFLYTFFPSVINILPHAIKGSDGYRNAVFSIISTGVTSNRNFGIFWEPGAFAIFLNIAFLFEMTDKNQSLSKLLVFILTVITTMSTLGIVCLIILIAIYIFNKKAEIINYKRNRLFLLLISIITAIYLITYNKDFVLGVFGKLLPNAQGNVHLSTDTRIKAVKYSFETFMSSPFLGVGYSEFVANAEIYCYGMPTCTFLNWLAIYGVFGIPFVTFCLNNFLRHADNIIAKLGLFVFTMLLFSTENFCQIGFVYIFVFYGISSNHKKPTSPSKT